MYVFLISFLTLYGGLHLYAFARLRDAFNPGRPISAALASSLLLMTIAPLLVRTVENSSFCKAALWIAWPAYIWMGCMFIFCTILAAIDLLSIAAWLSQRTFKIPIPEYLSATITCEAALFLALLASAYAFYEARTIKTDTVTITTDKLSPAINRIRLVQISDVHVGLLFREARLESVLRAVRAAQPDILISTGDLVDGRLSREESMSRLHHMAAMLAAVPTRLGKFAVTGNHEFYAGLDQSLEFTHQAGFTVLRNQSISFSEGISICGIDDPARRPSDTPQSIQAEAAILQSAPAQNFRLLLKHRPEIPESSNGLFDLQLSGHVHKGQIFPFNLLVRLEFPIPCGTTTTTKNSAIHVSRGSGTWGPPMRLLAPPEVTIIDIVSVPR
jgi:predicted MPP superfamily phosphohydrolase